MLRPFVALTLALAGAPARAQPERDGLREAPREVTPREPAREPLVARTFKLEHQSPDAVARAVRYLGSGDRDARIDPHEGLEAIAVRDRAANVAAIEQAIQKLDVARPDVTFHLRVLVAGPQGPGDVPPDMQKVVRQLEQNLRFKAYHQVAALTQRVRSGAKLESHGTLQLAPPVLDRAARVGYELELRPVVGGGRKGARTIQLRSLDFELEGREIGKADIHTDLVVPEGETVVVGTAALGDRAMVLVVWATAL
jgi:hypothetical protein